MCYFISMNTSKSRTFKQKPCKHCGVTFSPKWSGHYYCRLQCQMDAHTFPDPSGCKLWRGANVAGYGSLTVKRKSRRAHCIAWELVNGPVPKGLLLRHTCDTRACLNVDHLILGTIKDNAQDAMDRNRVAVGNGLPHTKLNPEQVIKIRQALASGETCSSLARQYNVHRISISQIKFNKSYKWLK
jgi:hypothetical protein